MRNIQSSNPNNRNNNTTTNQPQIDEEDSNLNEFEEEEEEEETLLISSNKQKYLPIKTFSTFSLFTSNSFISTISYQKFITQERNLFLLWFLFFIITSPLIFRYSMGSNLILTKSKLTSIPPTNGTIEIQTNWNECIACKDVYGVTLYNLTVVVSNVTSPNPNAQTPSIALFASQDLVSW